MSNNQKGRQYKLRFIDDEDHQKLKDLAEEDSRSINFLINKAIKNLLKESAKA